MRRALPVLVAVLLLAGCGTGEDGARVVVDDTATTAPTFTTPTRVTTSPSTTRGRHSTSPRTRTTQSTDRPHPPACGTPPGGSIDGKLAQRIVFRRFKAAMWPNSTVRLSACATSGLPVTFAFEQKFACTLTGLRLSIVQPGWCTVTATQPGDSRYAAAEPVTRKFLVDPQVVTPVWASTPSGVRVGDAVELTLKVTSPSGTVDHGSVSGSGNDACPGSIGAPISHGKARVTITAASVGTCTIHANVNGDQFIHGVSTDPMSFPVTAAP